ncbi:hypothetical protein GCM10020254_32460 [Streptomyces goshikiensis]
MLRQEDPAVFLLLGAAAQRVELELVLREPAHQPVTPQPRLSRRIRITTFGEQSDPHEWHPRSPVRAVVVGPATRRGRTQADMPKARRTVVRRATGRGEES